MSVHSLAHQAHAALPAALRCAFTLVNGALEHNDVYASASHRAEQLHDAERALDAVGFEVVRLGAALIVRGRRAAEACEGCQAPSPKACRCEDELACAEGGVMSSRDHASPADTSLETSLRASLEALGVPANDGSAADDSGAVAALLAARATFPRLRGRFEASVLPEAPRNVLVSYRLPGAASSEPADRQWLYRAAAIPALVELP